MKADTASIRPVAEAALSDGERLLWVGRPNPLRLTRHHLIQPLFGLVWTATILFMFSRVGSPGATSTLGRTSNSGFFMIFQLVLPVFLLVGLGLILSPVWRVLQAWFTIYALTSERALIIERLPGQTIRSYPLSGMEQIERRGNQVEGDVVFAREARTYTRSPRYGGPKRRRVTIPVGFLGIANPREVERLLLNQLQERGRQQNAW